MTRAMAEMQYSPTRKHVRYRAGLDVLISDGSQAVQSRIIQVSRGGCLVFPTTQPSTEVRLSFRLTEDAPPINCKGEVAYTISDRGTGIAFTEISLYNQDLITQHFEKQPSPTHG
jgi:PilZ domain-containing protein